MAQPKEVVYHHKNFGDLSKKELDVYLDFLANALYSLNSFEVWEAENVLSEEDSKKWDKEALKTFNILIDEKTKSEDKIYGNA